MNFAYADPPYLGCCRLYGHHHPEGARPFDGRCWDDPETHRALFDWLAFNFDGWVLALLNVRHGDSLVDVFPGTGSMTLAHEMLSTPIHPEPSPVPRGGETKP